MAEKVEDLILEHLHALPAEVVAIKEDTGEIRSRLHSLEGAVAGLRRESASAYGDIVDQHARYDRLAERIARLERRLDMRDEP